MRFKFHRSDVSNKKLRSRINAYFIWFLLYIQYWLVNRNSQNSFAIIPVTRSSKSVKPFCLTQTTTFFTWVQFPIQTTLYIINPFKTWSNSRVGETCFTAHLVTLGSRDRWSFRSNRTANWPQSNRPKSDTSYASWRMQCLRIILLMYEISWKSIRKFPNDGFKKIPIHHSWCNICIPYRTT